MAETDQALVAEVSEFWQELGPADAAELWKLYEAIGTESRTAATDPQHSPAASVDVHVPPASNKISDGLMDPRVVSVELGTRRATYRFGLNSRASLVGLVERPGSDDQANTNSANKPRLGTHEARVLGALLTAVFGETDEAVESTS